MNPLNHIKRILISGLLAVVIFALAACSPTSQPDPGSTDGLKVVVTTTIVADIVKNVGGQNINLTTLLPLGSDPHSFEPTPQDIARVADADLIFINGAGLETFMDRLLQNSGTKANVLSVSDGITLRAAPTGEDASGDPHTWTDPNNVQIWADNIAAALSQRDSANRAAYQANAEKYRQELVKLDQWIRQQVAEIQQANRQLVTDHELFGYFADRYGFTQVGTVIPGYSTVAQTSAQDLASLEEAIRNLGVKAIFVGNSVNPSLEERVAADTNIHLVYLYTGSLSGPDGPAGTYLDYTRYNVDAIVQALK